MSTLAQMRSRIADDLDRTDLSTQIDKAINRAIEYYEKERFYFQETTGTFSTIANQQAYGTADGLPSDIKEIDILKLTISTTNIPALAMVAYEEIASIDVSAFASQPNRWAWYQSKVYLYPRPNAIWTVTLSYQKSYTVLSSDSDTSDWTTKAEDLIESCARGWVNRRVIKDYDGAKIDAEDEMRYLAAMREKTRKLKSTGRVSPTNF